MEKLIKFKLFETLTRSFFLLTVIYGFSLETSGLFGLFIVILNLSSVFIGFERYISFQRDIVNKPPRIVQEQISDLVKLYLFNLLLIAPFFCMLVKFKLIDSPIIVFATLFILLIEQLSIQIYNISIVCKEYVNLMIFIILKYIILIVLVLYILYSNLENPFLLIICSWILLGFLQLIPTVYKFVTQQNKYNINFFTINFTKIFQQYKFAKIHFLIGIFAVISLQLDRVIVGFWFSIETMGVYYRHVTLIGLLYQIFNICSYNRLIPLIYKSAKSKQNYGFIKSTLFKEYLINFVILICISLFLITLFSFSYIEFLFNKYLIELDLLILLLLVFSIQIYANFRVMIYNAYKSENFIIKYQLISLIIGLIMMTLLIPVFGIKGIIYGSIISAITFGFLLSKSQPNFYK